MNGDRAAGPPPGDDRGAEPSAALRDDRGTGPGEAVLESLVGEIATRGHFPYESGHHGDLWLDLDTLLADPRRMTAWAAALARRVSPWRPELVAGPQTGGAFVAQLVAAAIGVGFASIERTEVGGAARYAVPAGHRTALAGRRVALVDDAVNAGSAVLASLADVVACGGAPVGIACLIGLGDAATRIAAETGLPFAALVAVERRLWAAEECPMCRSSVPLGPA